MTGSLRMLATQATGTSGPVGSLLTNLAMFTVGGPIVAGVLIGIAAIAKAYDLITRGAKEAAKEQKALADALASQFRPKTGPRSLNQEQYTAALKEQARLGKEIADLEGDTRADPFGFKARKVAELLTEYQKVTQTLRDVREQSAGILQTVTTKAEKVKELVVNYDLLRNAIDKVRAATEAEGMAFWRAYGERGAAIDADKRALQDLLITPIAPVDISDSARSAGQQAQDITDNATRNSEMVKNAIWGAASQSANMIVSALNIGGGGRGSGLGGALGGTAGFAAGYFFGGPIGGAIGSTVGNILGSAIGGLFDSNKKAVNTNTQALIANTAALLLNAPSGYKTASGRFDATAVKELRRAAMRFSTRGGAPVWVTP